MPNKNSFLRRLVAGVFLFTIIATPLQAVFACDLVDGQVSRTCCCGDQMSGACAMGGGCDLSSAQAGSSCCQVSFDDSSSITATPNSHPKTFHPPDDPQPQFPYFSLVNPPQLPHKDLFALNIPLDPSWHRGTQTYLVTLRLRN